MHLVRSSSPLNMKLIPSTSWCSILKDTEQSDMLRRIGNAEKVMGLLRLMGNKADVVKGLAKRCNENWRVAPTSIIVSSQAACISGCKALSHFFKIGTLFC